MTQTSQQPDDSSAGQPALVVDTGHLAVVQRTLDELLVRIEPGSMTSGALGLTRITLRDADGEPLDELDGLLAEVRRRIAATHGGWVPQVGKDREARSTVTMMRGGNPKPTGLAPEVPSDADLIALVAQPRGATVAAEPSAATPAVRVGLVDTPPVDFAVPVSGVVPAWQGHASFVRSIVEGSADGIQVRLEPALTGPGGTGTGWDVANAIARLVADGDGSPHILLLPLACFTADGLPPLLIERAVAAVPESTLIIAAAGNQTLDPGWSVLGRGPTNPAWPAALPRVKAVGVDPGRIEPIGTPLAVQPWVDALTDQISFLGDFFAGEVEVATDVVEAFAGTATWRGTSFSAARAAGLVAARMLANPGTTATDTWNRLLGEGGSLTHPPAAGQS